MDTLYRGRHYECRPDIQSLGYDTEVECAVSGGTLTFNFTNFLQPRLVRKVNFAFRSDLRPKALVEKISEQYGLRPAIMPDAGAETAAEGFSWVGLKGPLAEWKLSDDLTLDLMGFQKYRLTLQSKQVDALDNSSVTPKPPRNMTPMF